VISDTVMPRRSASCRSRESSSSESFTVVRFMVCQHTISLYALVKQKRTACTAQQQPSIARYRSKARAPLRAASPSWRLPGAPPRNKTHLSRVVPLIPNVALSTPPLNLGEGPGWGPARTLDLGLWTTHPTPTSNSQSTTFRTPTTQSRTTERSPSPPPALTTAKASSVPPMSPPSPSPGSGKPHPLRPPHRPRWRPRPRQVHPPPRPRRSPHNRPPHAPRRWVHPSPKIGGGAGGGGRHRRRCSVSVQRGT
jgi:serine/arginine repetitive matrix protein 1